MELLFYRKETNKSGKFFEKLFGSMVKDIPFKIFHDLGRLIDSPQFKVPADMIFFIITIDSFQELKQIISKKDILKQRRVLLILPDQKKSNLIDGPDTWYPDFMSSDNGFIDTLKQINDEIGYYRQKKVA